MSKIAIIFKMLLLLMVLQSCTNDPTGGGINIPTCEWNDTETVTFENYDLQLIHTSELSGYHYGIIPLDRIERSLINILETNGDAPNGKNSSNVRVNIKSDGTQCIGSDFAQYTVNTYAGNVGISDIKVPFPSNADFFGEVTVTIRTDVFNNTLGSDAYYYVLWDETGNNPNGDINGILTGKKMTHINIDGTQSILVGGENGYLYKGGVKNYL